MILLRHDCLEFKMADGEIVPCSAEQVVVELIGETAEWLDTEMIQHAAAAVLHYFKFKMGRQAVSVAEFTRALEEVLCKLGFKVASPDAATGSSVVTRVTEADLLSLAVASGDGFELLFFARLREEVAQRLGAAPELLRFHGLRGCVKHLTGAKRWSGRCQELNDRIVEFLRQCLTAGREGAACSLIVS